MKLRVYTDGACSGNPGPGGWAAVVALPHKLESVHGNDTNTTNNRMELTAVIEGIKYALSGKCNTKDDSVSAIDVYSDSAYVVNAINNNWIAIWRSNNWMTQSGKSPVKNQDLWGRLINILGSARRKGIAISFVKVKGHSGNTFNEMVDKLAVGESIHAQAVSNTLCGRG